MIKETEEATPIKTIPKCHAERCPNCNGFGSLAYGKKTCVSCLGKGYVIVPNELNGDRENADHNK